MSVVTFSCKLNVDEGSEADVSATAASVVVKDTRPDFAAVIDAAAASIAVENVPVADVAVAVAAAAAAAAAAVVAAENKHSGPLSWKKIYCYFFNCFPTWVRAFWNFKIKVGKHKRAHVQQQLRIKVNRTTKKSIKLAFSELGFAVKYFKTLKM